MDDEQGDAATQAFEEVRAEVTLLRRAIERLAAERAEVPEQPDYSETLGRMAKAINTSGEQLMKLSQAAQDGLAPRTIADRIVAAGGSARAEDQRLLTTTRGSLDEATRRLNGMVASATAAHEQKRRLAWTAIGGVALGMALWATFAGVVARAAPESWLWPERMAARTLRLDTWAASRRLAAVSRPEQWNAMIRGGLLVQDNRAAIERCARDATRAGEAVRCTVRISPEERQ